ncbi:MAG: YopX family protein [Peptostreptococcaceae bacterium]
MKEIKLRAWDKETRTMIVDKQDFIPLMVTNKGILRLSPLHKENLYEVLCDKQYKIMQYIGMKDSNGIEIYEGDIVIHESRNYVLANPYCNYSDTELREYFVYDEEEDDYYEEECTYMKVEYDNEKAMVTLTDIFNDTSYNFLDNFEYEDVKVIGNIYENPELLEVK